jgi:hypothetical protein
VLVISGGQAGLTLGHQLPVVPCVSVGAAISSCQAALTGASDHRYRDGGFRTPTKDTP